jgi:hypothetical protein
MRRATRARLGRRFGVPGDGDAFPTVVAIATGLPPQRVEDGLAGPEPRTDEELIRLGSLLSEIESRSMSPPGAPLGATTGNDTGSPDTRGARL